MDKSVTLTKSFAKRNNAIQNDELVFDIPSWCVSIEKYGYNGIDCFSIHAYWGAAAKISWLLAKNVIEML